MNEDPLPFDASSDCGPGGLYFTPVEHVGHWLGLATDPKNPLTTLWDVTVPEGEPIVEFDNKAKAYRVIRWIIKCCKNVWQLLRISPQRQVCIP